MRTVVLLLLCLACRHHQQATESTRDACIRACLEDSFRGPVHSELRECDVAPVTCCARSCDKVASLRAQIQARAFVVGFDAGSPREMGSVPFSWPR
jgi:hypothetical protein